MPRKSLGITLVLGLTTLLWIAPSESASPEQEATVLGQVLDGVSFDPLSHTEVRVDGTGLASLTDAKGGFTLEGVPPGRYQILFRRSCYYPTRVEVTVPEDSPRPIVLRLSLPLASEETAEGNCILHFAPS